MFDARDNSTATRSAVTIIEVMYHATVRHVVKSNGNAIIALLLSILQTSLMVLFFWVMFSVLSMRPAAVRGDFVLYLLSGVFLYFTHVKTVKAVQSADGPNAGMMKHAPMNTAVSMTSAALGTLYIQILSLVVILFIYHAAVTPISIDNAGGAFVALFFAWLSGFAIGVVFYALKPWAPRFVEIFSMIYTRANMIASGKMFLANQLPGFMLAMFDWNPLFHLIDQARGFTFINYNPHFTSMSYPIYVTLGIMMIGLMGEFYTRRNSSASWAARQ